MQSPLISSPRRTIACSFRSLAVCFAWGLLFSPLCPAFLRAQPAISISQLIDQRIDEKLREQSLTPGKICDDATFMRRVTLDLTGRNPTTSEVLTFLKDTDENKRTKLVDRLLLSPVSAVHLANIWSSWLLPEMQALGPPGGRNGLHTWLRNRFAENLRYDRLVADLLVATGSTITGPGFFFVSLEGKPEKIAAKTARVFLGVQLDCAECHDHPFDHWKQRDFWGFAAYFSRVSAGSMRAPGILSEVSDLAEGEVTLPNSEQVIPPQPLVSTGLSGLESGTRRQQLTLWLTARENPYLARAAVNRCWSILFGRGLIEPVDDMRSIDIASHPELLQELAREFSAGGYNLRALISGMAKSKAYQRETYVRSSATHDESNRQVPVNSYATMPAKPLTAIQLANCLQQVARDVAGDGPNDTRQIQNEALAQQLGKLRGDSSAATLGIVQALVTLHSDQLAKVHEKEQSRLLQALTAPHLSHEKRIGWLFLSTLCRPPTSQELKAILDSIDTKEQPPNTVANIPAWQADLLWALINSTEFAMTP